jgi:hypothetical protein
MSKAVNSSHENFQQQKQKSENKHLLSFMIVPSHQSEFRRTVVGCVLKVLQLLRHEQYNNNFNAPQQRNSSHNLLLWKDALDLYQKTCSYDATIEKSAKLLPRIVLQILLRHLRNNKNSLRKQEIEKTFIPLLFELYKKQLPNVKKHSDFLSAALLQQQSMDSNNKRIFVSPEVASIKRLLTIYLIQNHPDKFQNEEMVTAALVKHLMIAAVEEKENNKNDSTTTHVVSETGKIKMNAKSFEKVK